MSNDDLDADKIEIKGVVEEYKLGKYGGQWLAIHHTAFIILPMFPAFVVTIIIFLGLLMCVDWFLAPPI